MRNHEMCYPGGRAIADWLPSAQSAGGKPCAHGLGPCPNVLTPAALRCFFLHSANTHQASAHADPTMARMRNQHPRSACTPLPRVRERACPTHALQVHLVVEARGHLASSARTASGPSPGAAHTRVIAASSALVGAVWRG